jgi:hypothetical protein
VCRVADGERQNTLSRFELGAQGSRYVAVATATRPYFGADKDAPVEDFVAEAGRHPVFELLAIDEDRPRGNRGP